METLSLSEQGPIAIVDGKPYTSIPDDLFIPPDALEVLLDTFEGPLDLLLYLIKKQNIDILNIPMILITKQYLQYIHIMKAKRLELAADYLVMAALLMAIKSRMLLPISPEVSDEIEEDPRMVLVRRLEAYEQFKALASSLDELPRLERDIFPVQVQTESLEHVKMHPPLTLIQLVEAFQALAKTNSHKVNHMISRETLSVEERMSLILLTLKSGETHEFKAWLSIQEGRLGVVVTLLAILELAKHALLSIIQVAPFTPIYVKNHDE